MPVSDDAPPLEDRLRSAMDAGVEAVEATAGVPVADPADLGRRRVAHHRRRVAGRGAAAVLLVAVGVGAGVVLTGDPGGDDGEEVAAREDPTTTAPARTDGVVIAAGQELPVVAPSLDRPLQGSGGLLRGETDTGLMASLPIRIRPLDRPWYAPPILPTVPLFTRTLDDGTTIAVAGNRYDPAIYELPAFWEPPAQCFPTGDLVVSIDRDGTGWDAVGNRYDAVVAEDLRVAAAPIGPAEDRWLAVVQGPPGTASIRVTFPGGVSDEMAPADGVAVLTAPVVDGVEIGGSDPIDDAPAAELTAVALDAEGAEVARYVGPWTLVDDTGEVDVPEAPVRRADCAWPTTLPAPGPEQPADPAAAEAAVRAVWDGAFGRPGVTTDAQKLAVVDDTRGVAEGLADAARFRDVLDLTDDTTRIDGVVFTSATEAHVQYTIDPGFEQGRPIPGVFGELVLVDGEWKVTRLTVCRLVILGNGRCAPLPTG